MLGTVLRSRRGPDVADRRVGCAGPALSTINRSNSFLMATISELATVVLLEGRLLLLLMPGTQPIPTIGIEDDELDVVVGSCCGCESASRTSRASRAARSNACVRDGVVTW